MTALLVIAAVVSVLVTGAALALDRVTRAWPADRAAAGHRVWAWFVAVATGLTVPVLIAALDGGVAAWGIALVSAGLLAQLGAGWWRVRRIARLAEAPAAPHAARIRVASGGGGETRPRILVHPRLQTALTWGWRRPVVMLPAAWAGWPVDRLDAVVRHELAHVRRRDYVTSLAAAVAGATLWFVPGLWLARRRLRWFAELAADAEAAAGVGRELYARHLLAAAGLRPGDAGAFRLQFAPGQVSLVNRSGAAPDELRRRVDALLSRRQG